MEYNEEELLAKANKPQEIASQLHSYYKGKIAVTPKCRVKDLRDFDVWYSPGVASPCMDIVKNPEKVYELTCKWNTVAVISDGTRVLGLGDIGPHAALPVMEGKALIYKYLGGVDAFPICLDTKDPDKFIETVLLLHPSFGGINLEDIAQPKCFDILDRLRKESPIPVWHDDQQGTATVTLAGLVNALKVVDKKIEDVKIVFMGAGASNIRISDIIFRAGADAKKCIMYDSKGPLHKNRTDINDNPSLKEKSNICRISNEMCFDGPIDEALRGADVLIALSKPGPDSVKSQWISKMAKDSIVFVCANPVPEIWPWEAKKAGARIVATGRSDFPNQVNNSLGFPGIFRGVLDVRAKTITDEMCIAAAMELAKTAEDKGLSEDYIIPAMDEWEVFPREAAAVGTKAIEQGIAEKILTWEELYKTAESIISKARQETKMLTEEGFIGKNSC
ncbi:MAG: NADP-dependent malic enzyme [Planctomycetes bacterium]|nr:NADP-dependent malic enzyme [Planctomycetota bacterium]MBL7144641.1 NADP-dependent malic enzyme [Phycisphaerae bacterium]